MHPHPHGKGRNPWTRALALLALGTLVPLALAQPAAAPDQKKTADESDDKTVTLEKFVVTGSFIPQASTEPVGPVAIFSEQQIRATGAFTPIEALRSLPSFIGNPGPTEFDSNGGNGSTGVSLRGLGVSQTLVLINGRVTGQFGNIQLIPIEAVERIEVLRDGAGVIYGSSAIAGAVNVILKKNYTGTTLDFSGGAATRSPGSRETFQASFVTGVNHGSTSLMVSGSYSQRETIYASQRPNSAESDNRPRGGVNGGSPTYPGVIQINGGASPRVLRPGFTGTPTLADYIPQDQNTFSSNQLFNFREYSPSTPGQDRNSFYASLEQEMAGKRLVLFASALMAKLSTSNGLAPAPFALDAEADGPAVGSLTSFGPYNPGLGFENGDFFRYRSVELGNRTQTQTFKDTRWQVGLRGEISENWSWEAAMTVEEEDFEEIDAGVPSLPALDAEVAAGNFNPFAPAGSTGSAVVGGVTYHWDNAAALERAATKARIMAPIRNRFYDFRINGVLAQLPAGDLAIAGGYETQSINSRFDPDDLYASGSVLGLNSFEDGWNGFEAKSYFAEVRVPLLSGKNKVPFVHNLTLGAVARHEDQTIKGENATTGLADERSFDKLNPSVVLRYSPTKDYLIRASWSQGFVAPTPATVFGNPVTSNPTLADPLGFPTKAQTTIVIRSNPDLQPTESEAIAFGLVGTPSQIPGLSFQVDFYQNKVTKIGANNAASILALNAAGQGPGFVPGNPATINPNAPFAELIHRQPTGALRDTGGAAAWTQYGVPAGIRGAVLSDFVNIGSRDVQGIEYAVSYEHKTNQWGRFRFELAANQFIKFDQTNGPGLPTVSYLGKFVSTVGDALSPGSIPKWKANFGTTWAWKNFTTNLMINYVGSYQDDPLFVLSPKMQEYFNAGTPITDPAYAAFLAAPASVQPKVGGIRDISAFTTVDLQVSYAFKSQNVVLKNLKLTVGATNLFDKLAPFAAGAFNDSYDTRTVNNVGRFCYVQVRKQF